MKVRDKGPFFLSPRAGKSGALGVRSHFSKIAFPNMVPKRLRVSLSRDGLTPWSLEGILPILCTHTPTHAHRHLTHLPQGDWDLPPFSHQYQQPLI